jgi:LacI family transcriptional regulator
LAALRHERIAFITGPLSLKSARARKDAFQESMREIGMNSAAEWIIEGDHTMEGGMKALAQLAGLSSRPTAP